jgi:hypothetical protein
MTRLSIVPNGPVPGRAARLGIYNNEGTHLSGIFVDRYTPPYTMQVAHAEIN